MCRPGCGWSQRRLVTAWLKSSHWPGCWRGGSTSAFLIIYSLSAERDLRCGFWVKVMPAEAIFAAKKDSVIILAGALLRLVLD